MKPVNITVVLLIIAAAVGIYFFVPSQSNLSLGSSSGSQAAPLTSVSFRVLLDGDDSNINDRVNYVIRSDVDLRKLWTLIESANDVPTIDFSKEEVVAIFAGQEKTAGYTIGVSNVGDSATSRLVEVTVTKPGSSCSVAQQTTTPFQIVAFDKTTLPLAHTDTTKVLGCVDTSL